MNTRSRLPVAVGLPVLLLLTFWLLVAGAAASAGPAPAMLPTSTIVGGIITVDTTWTPAGSPYILQDDHLRVADNVTLTIEAGVTVQINTSRSLWVDGKLLAVGTPTQPITFTRMAGITQPWGYLQIGGGIVLTDSNTSRLSYATIEGGGSGGQMLYLVNSTPTLDHLTLRNSSSAGLHVSSPATNSPVSWDTGTVTGNTGEGVYVAEGHIALNHVDIGDNGGDGVWLMSADDSQLLNSTVENNGGHGIYVYSYSDRLLLEGLTIAGNAGYGIYMQSYGAGSIVRDTTVEGNGVAARLHPDTSLDNVTWTGNTRSEIEWIYGLLTGDRTWARLPEINTYRVLGNVTAPDNTRLSVEPGVTVQLGQSVSIYAPGGLTAVGTPTQPITFTRLPGATQPWGMIEIGSGNENGDADDSRVSYATIEGGGSAGKLVHLYYTSARLDHVTVRNSSSIGIQVTPWAGTQVSLDTVAVTNNAGVAVYHSLPGPSLSYRGLTLQGNGTNAVSIGGGAIGSPMEWDLKDAGAPVRIGSVYVQTGGFLALMPGTRLEFTAAAQLLVYVDSGLYAFGSAQDPITLTATLAQPGAWKGVWLATGSHAILRNCNIEYGGAAGEPALKIQSPGATVLANSSVRHAAADGIQVDDATPPLLSYNDISTNAFGVRNNTTNVTVDARRVWWGDATGPYHATLNPDGLGNAVGDRVLFEPWLTGVPTGTVPLGGLIVQAIGPLASSPGKSAYYGITYLNETGQEIRDAVLVFLVPDTAAFVETYGGIPGVFWPGRHQVFWRLGTIPAGEGGMVYVHIRYYWGIPAHVARMMALMAGSNQGETAFDLASYLAYDPVRVVSTTALTPAEVDAERQAYPALDAFFVQGQADGFVYASAKRFVLSSARTLVDITLNRPDRSGTMHILREGQVVQAYVLNDSSFTLHTDMGDMIYDRATDSISFTGELAGEARSARSAASDPVSNRLSFAGSRSSGLKYPTIAACYANCLEENTKVQVVKSFFRWIVGLPPVTVTDAAAYAKCEAECAADPTSHYCIRDRFLCKSSIPFFPDTAPRIMKHRCDIETGKLNPIGEYIWQCSLAFPVEKCVVGPDGMPRCVECPKTPRPAPPEPKAAPAAPLSVAPSAPSTCPALQGAGGGCATCQTVVYIPKDPNAKYGPPGDLLPGELVSYTVTYENVGEGEAYGVYVEDPLSEHLDESTLVIGHGGLYLPASRTILWEIGELGPKGSPTASGSVTFTARLRDGLPGGTPIANQAVVYFPSVPEETPTNPVVNVIWPVAGVPMTVTVQAGQSVPVTLAGRDTGSGPLTFQVVDPPGRGTLSGSPPALTYTPFAGFSGEDLFTFSASNAITESRPAEVTIIVVPDPDDATPPTVRWTVPANNAVVGPISASAAFTDSIGPAYTPYVFAGFNETIDAATVTTATLRITGPDGAAIPLTASYSAMTGEAIALLRQPLEPRTRYTVRVTQGIKDLAGNALAADYVWTFRTAGSWNVYLPLVIRAH